MGNDPNNDGNSETMHSHSRTISGKRTPASASAAVRRYCVNCFEGLIKDCQIPDCFLWEWRFGKRPTTAKRDGQLPADRKLGTNSALKAIRAHCVECSGDNIQEVKHCPCNGVAPKGVGGSPPFDCPLWPYRFGMGIARAGKQGKRVDQEVQTDA